MVTPLERGVVVVHTNISEQKLNQIQLARYRDHLEEMVAQQTSQLEQSNAALRDKEARLYKSAQLLEQTGAVAKVGGWEIDLNTTMVDWTTQVFRIFEREPAGLQSVEQASSQYLPESQSKIRAAVAQALELGTQWDLELQAVTDKGHVRWVHTIGKVEQTGENEVRVFGSIHDITEEVLSRHAREDHQRSLQVCFDNQQTGVAVFSETVLLYCNPAFRYLLGYAATDSLEHLSMGSLVPSADQHYLNARHKRAKSYGETLPPKLIKLSGNGGVVVTCLLSGSIVPWNGEPQFLASVSPLGDSIRVEQEIRASEERYERLLVTQLEQQQTHIARELHDSMGSRLAGVVMLLGGVVQKHPELAVEIKMALDQIQIAAQSSRALAHSLVPVDALPGAFWRSLERLCLEYAKLASVECLFSMDGDFDEIDAEIGTHLFRIAQEALVNAVKHGHASRIEVMLEEREDSLAMTVVDNGSQLSPQLGGTSSSSGMGLKSMQARAKMVGGAFKWYVNDDGGMTVSVVWGLEPL
jgi:PAS domain S-box-containing protein